MPDALGFLEGAGASTPSADAFLDGGSTPAPRSGDSPFMRTTKDLASVVGPLEAGANLATGLVGGLPAYLGGGVGELINRAMGDTSRDPQETGGKFAKAVTYQPRSESGQRLAEILNSPFAKLTDWGKSLARKVADTEIEVEELTRGAVPASPWPPALVESGVSMIPALIPGGAEAVGAMRAPRGAKPRPTPETGSEAPSGKPQAPFPGEVPVEKPATPAKPPVEVPTSAKPDFPSEAGDLDGHLPKAPAAKAPIPDAGAFLDADVEKLVAAADAVAAGKPAPAGAPESLTKLAEVKSEMAAAAEDKRAKMEQAAPPVEEPPPSEPDRLTGPDGKPFASKDAAKAWAKKENVRGYQPKKTEGGYVLEPYVRSDKALAADRKRSEQNSVIDSEVDDLPTIIGKEGGISKEALTDLGLDPKDLDPVKGFFRSSNIARPAVRTVGGLSLDEVAERLDGHGFDVRDEYGNIDQTKVHALIDRQLQGQKVMTSRGYERMAREEAAGIEDDRAAEDQRALDEFGPGAFGANRFLDPALIKKGFNDLRMKAGDVMRKLFGEPGEHRNLFNPIRDKEQLGVARIERWATGEGSAIRRVFRSEKDREGLTLRLVTGNLEGLNEAQLAAAKRLQANYRAMGEYAQAAEMLDGLRNNYSPQIWDLADKTTRALIEGWRAARGDPTIDPGGPLAAALRQRGLDPNAFSPFTLTRSIADVIEGMKIGLKPKSLDAADLFETYARSMGTAVERGKTLKALKELVSDDGTMMVIPREQAPRNYVKIDNPELEGMRVHPDVAPAVRVLVETNNPGTIATVLQTLAYSSKRALVSYSFFHPKSLVEAWVGSGGNPLTVKQSIDAALKQYRDAELGDRIDKGLAAGLKIGAPLEDVLGRDKFQSLIDKGEHALDALGPNWGKPLKMAKALDEQLQRLTWDYLQTGLKLDTFLRKSEDLRIEYAGRLARGEITEAELDRQAAQFTNATFGGLNWERMLDSFQTPLARQVMSEVLSKQGRSVMQTALFAPDWMVSTFASWTNALPLGEATAARAQLARRYLGMSALYTFAIGNAMNKYFTGHWMFENQSDKKDAGLGDQIRSKLEVQLGDGRRMQLAKHFLEVPHAMTDPVQFAYNKLNPTLSTPIEELANKQWLSSTWAPDIWKKKDPLGTKVVKGAEHAAGKFVPITGRSVLQQGPAGLGGFFGFPIYGMTAEQKAQAKAERNR